MKFFLQEEVPEQATLPQASATPVTDLKNQAKQALIDLRKTSSENRERLESLKKLFSNATEEKKAREQANENAKKLRETKSALAKQVISLKKELKALNDEIKKATGGELVGSVDALLHRLEQLEWAQQTTTSPSKEKDLAKQIKALEKDLPAAKKFMELREQVRKKREVLAPLEKQLDDVAGRLYAFTTDGKKHHENLVKISAKIKALQKLIGEKLEEVSEKKGVLDSTKEKLHSAINCVHEKIREERKETEMQKREAEKQKQFSLQERKNALLVKAEEVKKKLLLGKKISMEEFQLLQETGI